MSTSAASSSTTSKTTDETGAKKPLPEWMVKSKENAAKKKLDERLQKLQIARKNKSAAVQAAETAKSRISVSEAEQHKMVLAQKKVQGMKGVSKNLAKDLSKHGGDASMVEALLKPSSNNNTTVKQRQEKGATESSRSDTSSEIVQDAQTGRPRRELFMEIKPPPQQDKTQNPMDMQKMLAAFAKNKERSKETTKEDHEQPPPPKLETTAIAEASPKSSPEPTLESATTAVTESANTTT